MNTGILIRCHFFKPKNRFVDANHKYLKHKNSGSLPGQIIFLAFIIFFIPNKTLKSQTPAIDSLKKSLSNANSNKLATLFSLCERGESMPDDTAMMFAKEARQISIRNNENYSRLQSDFFIAKFLNMRGRADSALIICNSDLQKITGNGKVFHLYAEFMWDKITDLIKLRKIKESIEACYQLIEGAEKYNDKFAKVIAYNNLGVNYHILENRAEELQWFNRAYDLIKDDSIYLQFPLVFTNLSAIYFTKSNSDSGYFFLKKAFRIARYNQNLRNEADCYTIQGLVYSGEDKMDSAERMLQKAVALQKRIGNIQRILVGLDGLESFYLKQKNYPKAIKYIKEAESYSRSYTEPLVFAFYEDLAECYKGMGNYKSYGETLDTLVKMKDSLYRKTRAEDLANLEAQYEVTSKEAFISKQKLEILHKNIWISIVALFTSLAIAASWLIYRRNKRKQRIALIMAEEKERRRIAADLHDNIGAYASAISEGIDQIENKKLISDASSIHYLKNNANEIITSLRNTIWAFNKDFITLTGISDRIKIYLQKIQPSYPDIDISLEEKISFDKRLSPVQSLNIFRIVQEALHNALQHSHGSKIIVNIYGDNNRSEIEIIDDGTGFDFLQVITEGNGIINMKKRAMEAGFELAFFKASPKGTFVSLTARTAG